MPEPLNPSTDSLDRSLDELRQLLIDCGWQRRQPAPARYEVWWHRCARRDEELIVPTDPQAGDFSQLYDRARRRLEPDYTRLPVQKGSLCECGDADPGTCSGCSMQSFSHCRCCTGCDHHLSPPTTASVNSALTANDTDQVPAQ